MAKFVIAGRSDCPFYARAELLADELKLRLPEFSVFKITLKPKEWTTWVEKTCKERDWKYHGASPLIWRELVNRGGKGILLGSCNEFLEFAQGYYGLTCLNTSINLQKIADENAKTIDLIESEEEIKKKGKIPLKITILNGENKAVYDSFPLIVSQTINTLSMANEHPSISVMIHSPDHNNSEEMLNGMLMEIEDCAYSDLVEVTCEWDLKIALQSSKLIIIPNSASLIDDFLLKLWKSYAVEVESVSDENAKIIVFGKHATTLCYILSQFCPKISTDNFFALTRHEENKVKSLLAKKLDVITADISNIVLFGSTDNLILNHSEGQVKGYNGAIWAPHIEGFTNFVNEMVYEKSWLNETLPQILFPKTGELEKSSNISLSHALCSQLEDIFNPNRPGLYSLGLVSKGWYGVQDGLVFSFPVQYKNNAITVVDDLQLTEELNERILKAAQIYQRMLDEWMEILSE